MRQEDMLLNPPAPKKKAVDTRSRSSSIGSIPTDDGSVRSDDGEGGEQLIHDFSSRNFFSNINFVHILQKLTKRKVHRVLLLVQYKSSVSRSSVSDFALANFRM